VVLERQAGGVMQWFVSRLLLPSELPPRQHGDLLIVRGLISFGAWLAIVLIGIWLFLPPKPAPMPDIGPAMKGPPVKLSEEDRRMIRSESKGFGALVAIPAVAIVFWGGYSSLMIGAGLFERFSGVPFATMNDWFNRLDWYKKIVAFPVLLVAMVVVIGMPFVILGIAGSLMGL
jgi:hypothetical protein